MKNLDELKIAKNYYKYKYLYIKLKMKKLEAATQSQTETEYKKTIIDDTIIIESITEELESETESEEEPEEDSIKLFFNKMIIKDVKHRIKRSDCYNRYVKYCESQQIEPKQKSIFFEAIEAFLGKPKKTNVY